MESIPQSALSSLISSLVPPLSVSEDPENLSQKSDPYLPLALQVQHNLLYQHDWSMVTLHSVAPLTGIPLPRMLVSGLPPRRVYEHPDDMAERLKRDGDEDSDDGALPEREWVLPSRLSESWSLRRFAEIFDLITEEPPEDGENELDPVEHPDETKRRGGKRLLLAVVGDDSTISYYVVHDGIVKPRQN